MSELNHAELREKLKAMISEEFKIPMDKLTPEATMDSLGIDSLSLIDFIFDVEDKFKLEMPDSRTPLKTLADVYAEIEKATPKG